MPFPPWVAVMVQGPADAKVSVLPLIEHADEVEVSVTPRPELAVAVKVGDVPMVWSPGGLKVMTCAARATVTLRVTGVAAEVVLLPDWLAVMVQVPAAWIVSVAPLTVHTPDVEVANDTVRPTLEVATSASGPTPKVWLPGPTKVMVCAVSGAVPTAKVCVTTAAAVTLALPGWLADSEHVPADTSTSVVPATVHTGNVVDTTVTGSPELELNNSGGGAVPRVWLPGELKLMVCAAGATLKVCVTGVAAEVVLFPA